MFFLTGSLTAKVITLTFYMIAETHLFTIDVITGRLSGLFAQTQLLLKMAAGKTGLGLAGHLA